MNEPENLGAFFKENKSVLKEYIETRLEIFRLQAIKVSSKSAGYLVWIVLSLFLVFLIAIFSGMTLGYWLSALTGSYIEGFGLTALIMLVLFVIIAVFKKKLLVNPVVKTIIRSSMEETDGDITAD